MDTAQLDEYREILKTYTPKPPREKNIFSIGGRGHYENPISDVLAFFLDDTEDHKFGRLFIDSLIDCIPDLPDASVNPIINTDFGFTVNREKYTGNNNRIDILIESHNRVVVIENKMYHWLANPLEDYVAYVTENYTAIEEPIFLVLSLCDEKVTGPWKAIKWDHFLDRIQYRMCRNFIQNTDIKWFVILREFMLNIREHIAGGIMDADTVKFVNENYSKITELSKLKQDYIEYVLEKGKDNFNGIGYCQIRTGKYSWEEATALRFYPTPESKTNITIVVNDNGKLWINYYIYYKDKAEADSTINNFKRDNYRSGYEYERGLPVSSFYGDKNTFNSIDEIMKELNEVAKLFRNNIQSIN